MCKANWESVDHLPLHCDAYAIWIAFFNRFGLSWVMHTHTVDQYACWWTTGSTRSGVVWKMMYTCLLWCLWREMNYRSFKDRERTLEEFFFFLTSTLKKKSAEGSNLKYTGCIHDTPNPKKKNTNLKKLE
jgi:hypothetical protein